MPPADDFQAVVWLEPQPGGHGPPHHGPQLCPVVLQVSGQQWPDCGRAKFETSPATHTSGNAASMRSLIWEVSSQTDNRSGWAEDWPQGIGGGSPCTFPQ